MYKSLPEKTEENLQNLKQPVKWGEDPKCVFVYLCVREREREERHRHGCHSNCVIMLVAIMKAMKTGKGRGLAQKP